MSEEKKKEFEILFDNNFDCYADNNGPAVPAMTRAKFIYIVEHLLTRQKEICRREFFTTIYRKIQPIIHQGLENAPLPSGDIKL